MIVEPESYRRRWWAVIYHDDRRRFVDHDRARGHNDRPAGRFQHRGNYAIANSLLVQASDVSWRKAENRTAGVHLFDDDRVTDAAARHVDDFLDRHGVAGIRDSNLSFIFILRCADQATTRCAEGRTNGGSLASITTHAANQGAGRCSEAAAREGAGTGVRRATTERRGGQQHGGYP
jgi:hypothetical protein